MLLGAPGMVAVPQCRGRDTISPGFRIAFQTSAPPPLNVHQVLRGMCFASLGFNPRWDCTLSFQLQVPELALVRFVVEDHDHTSKNDFVGQFTIPFISLRTGTCKKKLPLNDCYNITLTLIKKGITLKVFCCSSTGYRHIHLLRADGSSLSPATLFIHVKVTRRGIPIKTVSERMGLKV